MEGEEVKHKAHRKRRAGPKALKKQKKQPGYKEETGQRNPKAFTYRSAVRAAKSQRRTLDLKEKKHHIPQVDRTPLDPPPVLVAVVGPPRVGKSTLIAGLIKHFTRQNLVSNKGPITVVSGKKRRLTFVECNNDINSMIDIAKVADLVLLLVDASFGFEMETFEFLNILQVHGFPRVLGVLTHLDMMKNNKNLKRTKKKLKQRFWTEIYQGAKLFYITQIRHGHYLKNELHNLARFISVAKFKPLEWQSSHPYLLADRMEELTPTEVIQADPLSNRTISLYGYVHGTCMKPGSYIHIPGCGDFKMADLSVLPDPCPLPDKNKKRSLDERERLIYAPMSGVGGVIYDKDAIYIELGGSHSLTTNKGQSNDIILSLMNTYQPLDTKISQSSVTLVQGGGAMSIQQQNRRPVPVEEGEGSESEGVESDSEGKESEEESEVEDINGFFDDEAQEGEPSEEEESSNEGEWSDNEGEESDNEGEESNDYIIHEAHEVWPSVVDNNSDIKWKNNLRKRMETAHSNRQRSLKELVYGKPHPSVLSSTTVEREERGDLFHTRKTTTNSHIQHMDTSLQSLPLSNDWSNSDIAHSIKHYFVTGDWGEMDAYTQLLEEEGESEEELFGDYEDLETGEKYVTSEVEMEEERQRKKRDLKKAFDANYDNKKDEVNYIDDLKALTSEQAERNRKEFEHMSSEQRQTYEGIQPGNYVRLEIQNVPCEFIRYFDPSYPLIVGCLLSGEEKMGYVRVKLKLHRWYNKILKSHDPLVLSMGWRRFQTLCVYSTEDHNGRRRMLKYTPQHMHCMGSFYGPVTVPNTGVIAIQSVKSTNSDGFCIAATGVVTEMEKATNIVKKLKLVGTPFKIFKNTAFIKGMFNTSLECAKFQGALIRTVSGIRGQIKRSLSTPEGTFRATFEDKLLASDIVFLPTWVSVDVPRYYNPVTSLLSEDKTNWEGMRTVGQLRKDEGLKVPYKKDSIYKEQVRGVRKFNPLKIPRSLERQLPFKSRPKLIEKRKKESLASKRAVVLEPDEKRVRTLMQQLTTLHRDKAKKRQLKHKQELAKHLARKKEEEGKREEKTRELRKQFYQELGLSEKRKVKKLKTQ